MDCGRRPDLIAALRYLYDLSANAAEYKPLQALDYLALRRRHRARSTFLGELDIKSPKAKNQCNSGESSFA